MKLVILTQHRFELWHAPEWLSGRLERDFPQLKVAFPPSYDEAENDLRDAEVLIGWSLRPEQFKIATKLRWIHSPAAAVHQLMFPELVNSDIIVTNGSPVHGLVVAEHVLAFIFALAKRFPQAIQHQLKHSWGQQAMWEAFPRTREVAGATVGLIGVGSIGGNVAKHAASLGMRVIAVREDPDKPKPEGVETVFGPPGLPQLLAQSDYVVLSTPVTPQTKGLMNMDRIAMMKRDAYLINVGRGPLIDEEALIRALREKKIAGAALDVFVEEPLPPDSPLWDLENLFITPHTAGLTEKLWERQYAFISDNLRRYLNGQPLIAVVDKKRGY